MQKEFLFFTAGQFAKLHRLNKRTLHYYDDIGLFSPAHKGENGYRYYTYHQSADLENILALRELQMSIGEIKAYLKHPSAEKFLDIAEQKTHEIDRQIKRLKNLRALLSDKRNALVLCDNVYDGKIEAAKRPEEFYLLTPMALGDAGFSDMERIMAHLQSSWEHSSYKTGCGSYISLDKVRRGEFGVYDGLFTPVSRPKKKDAFLTRREGTYLCGYCIGNWDKLPGLYRKMLRFAQANGLKLTGNCYELGLNEFAISHMEEYVTQILIQCESG